MQIETCKVLLLCFIPPTRPSSSTCMNYCMAYYVYSYFTKNDVNMLRSYLVLLSRILIGKLMYCKLPLASVGATMRFEYNMGQCIVLSKRLSPIVIITSVLIFEFVWLFVCIDVEMKSTKKKNNLFLRNNIITL